MQSKKEKKKWILPLLLLCVIAGGIVYYEVYFTPKNSLELYQELAFADSFQDVQKLMEKGYEGNFSEEDFEAIQDGSMSNISQFTLFEYYDKAYVVLTSPGTERLKILSVDELPEEMRKFFFELGD